MEVTVEDCQAIIDAQKKSGAKLMIAYRLHHEPGTLDVIDRVRKGDFGDARLFSSVFTQDLQPDNHRAKQGIEQSTSFPNGKDPSLVLSFSRFRCRPDS